MESEDNDDEDFNDNKSMSNDSALSGKMVDRMISVARSKVGALPKLGSSSTIIGAEEQYDVLQVKLEDE